MMGWTVYSNFRLHSRTYAPDLKRATARIKKVGLSIEAAGSAFKELAKAMAKIPFPDFAQIRKMRLHKMKMDYGYLRFLSPEYYRWLMFR